PAESAAGLLAMTERDGFTEAIVYDPWNPGKELARYALVDSGSSVDVPSDYIRVEVPLRSAVVYSMVHTAALEELGEAARVCGIADVAYLAPDDPMRARVDSGKVADVGSSMSPTLEKIVELEPSAVLLSPMENMPVSGLSQTGIPLIYMADYMETTPRERARWIKFLGKLVGRSAEADSIFETAMAEYDSLCDLAAKATARPVVITERPYSGVWYMPAADSYKARMLADAGADFPWADIPGTGSLQLSEEAVIARGADADFWLLNESGTFSPERLAEELPHAKAFAAFPEGVYYCNTVGTPMFREIAFHPERMLADMVYIFHPELLPDHRLRYYQSLK
ncbi:MAG: ABC transporter substrate-binding protein, partial [Muribaculaceae bacterium]|nr:ABC transporter substrate-binding protein [Muribaculaceae bacterium]